LTLLFLLFFISSSRVSFAQWVSNPAVNNELAIETVDPVDISAVEDDNGGAFVFWQDNKFGFQNEIYFMHVDGSGRISFKADGKKITALSGPEDNPVCAPIFSNSAVVVWKDFTSSKSGNLMAQRVNYNGTLLWSDNGVEIASSNHEVDDYSMRTDNSGNTFVAYVDKEPEITGDYKIVLKKISPAGEEMFKDDEVSLNKSRIKKNMTSVIPDDGGGAYVFWLEVIEEKVILFGQHINPDGKETWGKKPVEISSRIRNVLNYTVTKAGVSDLYIAWQIQSTDRVIYHQFINDKGKTLWTNGGKLAANLKGNDVNPQAVYTDSSIVLSWTNEFKRQKEIVLQKFDKRGRAMWNRGGIKAVTIKSQQFGQHLISDGKGGVILAWIDSRTDSTYADIYAQRIDKNGNLVWNPLGLAAATNYNTPKSYLSLLSGGGSSAIVIFKNRRKGVNKIYAQKIFNTGNFVSQMSRLYAQVENDSVKVSWDVSNERGAAVYDVQRAVESDTSGTYWKTIYTFRSNGDLNCRKYDYLDLPDTSGTLYYRVEQTDATGNIQLSDVARVNYFGENSDIMVMQNNPNPFSDSTDISFYLPSSDRVTIEFYDSHVNMISQIDDKRFPSGESHITFSAQGLKPGIYFYRFKCEDYVEVKKMVITN